MAMKPTFIPDDKTSPFPMSNLDYLSKTDPAVAEEILSESINKGKVDEELLNKALSSHNIQK